MQEMTPSPPIGSDGINVSMQPMTDFDAEALRRRIAVAVGPEASQLLATDSAPNGARAGESEVPLLRRYAGELILAFLAAAIAGILRHLQAEARGAGRSAVRVSWFRLDELAARLRSVDLRSDPDQVDLIGSAHATFMSLVAALARMVLE